MIVEYAICTCFTWIMWILSIGPDLLKVSSIIFSNEINIWPGPFLVPLLKSCQGCSPRFLGKKESDRLLPHYAGLLGCSHLLSYQETKVRQNIFMLETFRLLVASSPPSFLLP